jgi:hypothetical protein
MKNPNIETGRVSLGRSAVITDPGVIGAIPAHLDTRAARALPPAPR